MAELEELQHAHDETMRLIAIVMLINLAWGFFSPFFIENIIGPFKELQSAGYITCFVFWIIFLVISLGALILVAVRKSEAGATVGMLLGWPVALTIPLVFEVNVYLLLSSIAPLVLSVLTIRILKLASHIEFRRSLPPPSVYPVAPQPGMEEPDPPELRLYP